MKWPLSLCIRLGESPSLALMDSPCALPNIIGRSFTIPWCNWIMRPPPTGIEDNFILSQSEKFSTFLNNATFAVKFLHKFFRWCKISCPYRRRGKWCTVPWHTQRVVRTWSTDLEVKLDINRWCIVVYQHNPLKSLCLGLILVHVPSFN